MSEKSEVDHWNQLNEGFQAVPLLLQTPPNWQNQLGARLPRCMYACRQQQSSWPWGIGDVTVKRRSTVRGGPWLAEMAPAYRSALVKATRTQTKDTSTQETNHRPQETSYNTRRQNYTQSHTDVDQFLNHTHHFMAMTSWPQPDLYNNRHRIYDTTSNDTRLIYQRLTFDSNSH